MSVVFSIIVSLLILSAFIALHELGHYITGIKLGFDVEEYCIGMGPALYKHRMKNGVVFSLRALPIGGMCRFYGEDADTEDGKSFDSHRPWKKAIVLVSGALMNVLTGVLAAIITISIFGDFAPGLHSFADGNSPAERAGLKAGDVFISVDGKDVYYTDELISAIRDAENGECDVTVLRDGEIYNVHVSDMYDSSNGINYMGIRVSDVRREFSFFEAAEHSLKYVWSIVKDTFGFFRQLFRGNVNRGDVGSVVAIVDIISVAVRTNIEVVLRVVIIISISMGICNLLPFPALDGGRLVFVIIEAIVGKPVPINVQAWINFAGMILLLILTGYLIVSDFLILFGG